MSGGYFAMKRLQKFLCQQLKILVSLLALVVVLTLVLHGPPFGHSSELQQQQPSLNRDLFFKKLFQSALQPSKVYPFFHRKEITADGNGDVTLTTHVTKDRLVVLETLAQRFQGPISATLHLPKTPLVQEEIKSIQTFIQSSSVLTRFVDIHLIVDSFDRQFNYWRNVARFFATTPSIMMIDVDFLVSPGLQSNFRRLSTGLKHQLLTGQTVLVVPAFEFISNQTSSYPETKSELLYHMHSGQIIMFHDFFFYAHGPTNYNAWKTASEPYLVTDYNYSYEPYVIMSRDEVPWCDERFVGYGANKAACFYEMHLSGVKFFVLPEDFLIHRWHEYPEQDRKVERKFNHKLYDSFREEACHRHKKIAQTLGKDSVVLKMDCSIQSLRVPDGRPTPAAAAQSLKQAKQLKITPPYSAVINDQNDQSERTVPVKESPGSECNMDTCFDYSRCKDSQNFKVYVYDYASSNISATYRNILDSIKNSRFYTSDPSQACLFVPNVDTFDRDIRSRNCIGSTDEINAALKRLTHWNNGRNHLIFNMYSGTYPDYVERVDFEYGSAILFKASAGSQHLRPGFDVSFPLFLTDMEQMPKMKPPAKRELLASFKGKRYLNGRGKERELLRSIHSRGNIEILMSCRHLTNWEKYADRYCKSDNEYYETLSYDYLMEESIFSIVPTGRRLGSYRFLESLNYGSIPVVVTNSYELPFSEFIDWKLAVLTIPFSRISSIPQILDDISPGQRTRMSKIGKSLYDTYFSSLDKIVETSIMTVWFRIFGYGIDARQIWNSPPGALLFHPIVRRFYESGTRRSKKKGFTAVILSRDLTRAPLIEKMLQQFQMSPYVRKVVVVWNGDIEPPNFSSRKFPVEVVTGNGNSLNNRFKFMPERIKTEAILSLDDDIVLSAEDIDFAFSVWCLHADSIVGFPARGAHRKRGKLFYDTNYSRTYNMVLTGAAFYSNFYNYLYETWMPKAIREHVDNVKNCEDIAMNTLIAAVSRKTALKVTRKGIFNCANCTSSLWWRKDHFETRDECIEKFVSEFGWNPFTDTGFYAEKNHHSYEMKY